jgi:predicted RNA binding protein YcfA (HicA-like mRNA interferase family)
MKRLDLIRKCTEEGCVLVRSTGGHDIYRNVITGAMQPIPRHREINELLARSILRKLSTPDSNES